MLDIRNVDLVFLLIKLVSIVELELVKLSFDDERMYIMNPMDGNVIKTIPLDDSSRNTVTDKLELTVRLKSLRNLIGLYVSKDIFVADIIYNKHSPGKLGIETEVPLYVETIDSNKMEGMNENVIMG